MAKLLYPKGLKGSTALSMAFYCKAPTVVGGIRHFEDFPAALVNTGLTE